MALLSLRLAYNIKMPDAQRCNIARSSAVTGGSGQIQPLPAT